jgi:hypothetical protein
MQRSGTHNQSVYLGRLSASPKTDFGKRDFALQGYEQKVFSAIWELESLINDGGFQCYFGNGAEAAAFAPDALRAIGAPLCAAIVEEATALVPSSLPADWKNRWEAFHSLPKPILEQFASLNKRFFANPEDVVALLYKFVAAHPDIFGPTPKDSGTPAPGPAPTSADRDAMLHSLMDLVQGGPEVLLQQAGGNIRMEELAPADRQRFIELARKLNKAATEIKQQHSKPGNKPVGGDDKPDRNR